MSGQRKRSAVERTQRFEIYPMIICLAMGKFARDDTKKIEVFNGEQTGFENSLETL